MVIRHAYFLMVYVCSIGFELHIQPETDETGHMGMDSYWCALAAGMDGYTKVPFTRFNMDMYYIEYESGRWEMGYSSK